MIWMIPNNHTSLAVVVRTVTHLVLSEWFHSKRKLRRVPLFVWLREKNPSVLFLSLLRVYWHIRQSSGAEMALICFSVWCNGSLLSVCKTLTDTDYWWANASETCTGTNYAVILLDQPLKFDHLPGSVGSVGFRSKVFGLKCCGMNWTHRNSQWLMSRNDVRNSWPALMSLSEWTGVTQDAVACRWQCN